MNLLTRVLSSALTLAVVTLGATSVAQDMPPPPPGMTLRKPRPAAPPPATTPPPPSPAPPPPAAVMPSAPPVAPAPAPPPPAEAAPAAALPGVTARDARAERFVLHRVSGATAMALQLAALGTFVVDDLNRFGHGGGDQTYKGLELTFASASQLGMLTTYLLASTAPPRERTPSVNRLHQALMFAGGALNLARILFSVLLVGAQGRPDASDAVLTLHRITAVAAPVVMAMGISLQLF